MIWATWVCTNNPINTPLGLKISPTPLQNHLQFLKPNSRELLLLLLHVLLVFLTKLHLIKYPTSSDPDPRLLNQIGEKSKWVQKYGSWSFPSSAVRPRNRIQLVPASCLTMPKAFSVDFCTPLLLLDKQINTGRHQILQMAPPKEQSKTCMMKNRNSFFFVYQGKADFFYEKKKDRFSVTSCR